MCSLVYRISDHPSHSHSRLRPGLATLKHLLFIQFHSTLSTANRGGCVSFVSVVSFVEILWGEVKYARLALINHQIRCVTIFDDCCRPGELLLINAVRRGQDKNNNPQQDIKYLRGDILGDCFRNSDRYRVASAGD